MPDQDRIVPMMIGIDHPGGAVTVALFCGDDHPVLAHATAEQSNELMNTLFNYIQQWIQRHGLKCDVGNIHIDVMNLGKGIRDHD